MRYGQRGGYTPAEQERRERLRLRAAEWFEVGESTKTIAARLRVHERSVTRWRKAWREGGAQALRSKVPVSKEKLSARQWEHLEAELRRGPLAWGFGEDQRWTLGRIKTLIGRLFHVGYTIEGVGKLLHRHGWSVQVPARRAVERDEEAIAAWKDEVWPAVKPPRRTWAPTSASKTRRVRG
ncbi:winged helix-turn-helix domain-containing protein [Nonomuraea sp. NPDC046570]|uniref:winged helix-turn-helix domain-containing protein n=1 Tax=Nonomuraea sp. NPDC046570 TaxID=3155255 RepID=UPI0033D96437